MDACRTEKFKPLDNDFVLTLEQKQKILKERAKRYAFAPQPQEQAKDSLHVAAFTQGQDRFAIETAYVREVYEMTELTPVPFTPSFIVGVINVRGQILSVVDIKQFLFMSQKGFDDFNWVVIVCYQDMEFGILAQHIIDVQLIPLNDIQPPLVTLTEESSIYIKGVSKDQLVVLDGKRLLLSKRMIVQQEAL